MKIELRDFSPLLRVFKRGATRKKCLHIAVKYQVSCCSVISQRHCKIFVVLSNKNSESLYNIYVCIID